MTPAVAFSAVVLAGGHSRRMGTDKATLCHPDSDQPLLLHQLDLLGLLSPTERFVSARADQVLPPFPSSVSRLNDDGTAGPMGGITSTLAHITTAHLLVVAVDLPHLTPSALVRLLSVCTASTGAIARSSNGLEPLVAIYPRAIRPILQEALAAGRFGLQKRLQQSDVFPQFTCVDFPTTAEFLNWNAPDDL